MPLGDTLEVSIKVISDRYVATVVNTEWWVNADPFANVPDELLQPSIAAFRQELVGCFIWQVVIVLFDQFTSAQSAL